MLVPDPGEEECAARPAGTCDGLGHPLLEVTVMFHVMTSDDPKGRYSRARTVQATRARTIAVAPHSRYRLSCTQLASWGPHLSLRGGCRRGHLGVEYPSMEAVCEGDFEQVWVPHCRSSAAAALAVMLCCGSSQVGESAIHPRKASHAVC